MSDNNNNNEQLYLCFITYVGKSKKNLLIYDFYFSISTDEFWGDNFEYKPAGICKNLEPYPNTITEIKRTMVDFPLDLAQEQTCLSMQDVIDGCCALAWENIDNRDYPDDGRVIFPFGEKIEDVEKKLAKRNFFFMED